MLTEDDLTRLLGEAAEAYPVPDEGPGYVLEELAPARPWRSRRGLQLGAAAAVVVLIALVAPSLSTGSTASTKSSSLAGPISAPQPLAPDAANGAAQPQPQRQPYSGAVKAPNAATVGVPQKGVAGGSDEARVVQTGTVTLIVDKGAVKDAVKGLHATATGARGYVSDESSQETGPNPSATLTMRVPVASFDTVVRQIRALGAKVVSVESSAKDVTATYADTQAQIASLTAARQRFLTILSGAKTIAETLTVQQRVDDVQGQIDRLEGQRRVLQNQSDLATLTVTVSEKEPAVLSGARQGGFSKAWDDARHGFSSGVQALISRSGRALLVLLVAAVGFVVIRLGWRLARRRMV